MRQRLETAMSVVITLCAVVVAWSVIREDTQRQPAGAPEPTAVEDWGDLLLGGVRIGDSQAPVQIVEFGDFQCPFCKLFHRSLERVMSEWPGEVSLVYYHFPLSSIHHFAEPAARAAECARPEGLFDAMVSELYAQQDSLGPRPWNSYATAAGITDLAAFAACMEGDAARVVVESHVRKGNELAVVATPTVMINGWRFAAPPTGTLEFLVRELLAGRSPFPDEAQ